MLGWELPPHHTGGLGIVLLEIVKRLSTQLNTVDVLLPFKEEFETDGYRVFGATDKSAPNLHYETTIYGSSDFEKSEYITRYTEATVARLQEDEYDVVHAHDWLTFQAAITARNTTGVPVVAHVHATEFDRAGGESGNPVVHDIEYYGLVNADAVVTVSERTKADIVDKYSIPLEKVHVVHNRHESEEFHFDSPEQSFPYLHYLKSKGYKIVLSAGRVTLQKGLPFLLEAAKDVVSIEPKTMFMFVGNGDMLDEIIGMSADLGIAENVLFAGYHNGTGQEWRDAFRAADMFVMPSVSEPFGITPLEAMNFNTPAIISRQTGSGELVKNVIKFDYWDKPALVNAIVAVSQNQSLQDELAYWGKKEIDNLSWSDAAEQIIEVYKKTKKQKELVYA